MLSRASPLPQGARIVARAKAWSGGAVRGQVYTADLINYRSDSHKKAVLVSVRMILNDSPSGGF
jgi:hypothetical protein